MLNTAICKTCIHFIWTFKHLYFFSKGLLNRQTLFTITLLYWQRFVVRISHACLSGNCVILLIFCPHYRSLQAWKTQEFSFILRFVFNLLKEKSFCLVLCPFMCQIQFSLSVSLCPLHSQWEILTLIRDVDANSWPHDGPVGPSFLLCLSAVASEPV